MKILGINIPFTNAKNELVIESEFLIPMNSITATNAQKIATVFSCVDIKAKALSVMPIKLYKLTKNGKEENKTHKLYNLLRYEPNENLISSLYKKIISQDIDLRGNHYTQIVRNGLGDIVKLVPLQADLMDLTILSNGKKEFIYNNTRVDNYRVLHLYDIPDSTGLKGLSKIQFARESLNFAKNTAEHGNKLFENGATPTGIFEHEKVLEDGAFDRLKLSIQEKMTGLTNTGKPFLLEDGLSYKALTLTNSDSQWLESRKYNREEVAAIFGVPVAMLNDASNTAYGNLEQKYSEFYTGTVFPMTTIIEEQFRQSLLTFEEKQNLVIKFKYNALLRVDTKTRTEYYKARFDIGSITPNEVRNFEDENRIEFGDKTYVQLNLTTLENAQKTTPKLQKEILPKGDQ